MDVTHRFSQVTTNFMTTSGMKSKTFYKSQHEHFFSFGLFFFFDASTWVEEKQHMTSATQYKDVHLEESWSSRSNGYKELKRPRYIACRCQMNNTYHPYWAVGAISHIFPLGMGETLFWVRVPDGLLACWIQMNQFMINPSLSFAGMLMLHNIWSLS